MPNGGRVYERMIGDLSLGGNGRTCTDGHTRSTQDQNLLDFARFDPIGELFESSLIVILVLFGELSTEIQKLVNLISQLIHFCVQQSSNTNQFQSDIISPTTRYRQRPTVPESLPISFPICEFHQNI